MKTSDTNRWRARTRWAVVMLAACLLPAAPLAAQEDRADAERREHAEHLHWILEGLERGMESLEAIEARDAHEMLERIANDVRGELEHAARERPRRRGAGNAERRIIEEQTEVLRLAMRALLEAERRDAAHLVEQAIHARELMLEGRRDPEAIGVRERAPRRQQLIELLGLAERLYREFDLPDMADRIGRMTDELWPERRERQARRPREQARERAERERDRDQDRRNANAGQRERDRAERADRNERRRAERGRRGADRANDDLRERLDRLQAHLHELQREMENMRRELEHRGGER